MVVFGPIGCIWAKWFYSGKVFVLGQTCCIRAKRLYSDKVLVFGQRGRIFENVGVLVQNS